MSLTSALGSALGMLPKPTKTGASPAARNSLRSAGGSHAGLRSNQLPVWQMLSGQSPGGGVTRDARAAFPRKRASDEIVQHYR
jgi:hypothetical protein